MSIIYFSILYICFTFIRISSSEESFLCSDNYCDFYPYEGDPKCPVCEEEDDQNALFLPSPTTCNCCKYCVKYLKKGDFCSKSVSEMTLQMCGPGLFCEPNELKCTEMINVDTSLVNECIKSQQKYDSDRATGDVGDMRVRPECDEDGYFVPYHCIPGGICYCVDKMGNRIFGQMPNNGLAKLDLKCTCSRNHLDMSTVIGHKLAPDEFFRCASNGVYDRFQCIDDQCFCVDESDGALTFPDNQLIAFENVTSQNLECFDEKVNPHPMYRRKCEDIYQQLIKPIREQEKDYDYFVYSLPDCSLDGNFSPVQEDETSKYCVYPDGSRIKDYLVSKTSEDPNDATLLENMNCNCAIAETMIEKEKPSCDKNGNYELVQSRRGVEYEVDVNGNFVRYHVPS